MSLTLVSHVSFVDHKTQRFVRIISTETGCTHSVCKVCAQLSRLIIHFYFQNSHVRFELHAVEAATLPSTRTLPPLCIG